MKILKTITILAVALALSACGETGYGYNNDCNDNCLIEINHDLISSSDEKWTTKIELNQIK